MSMFGLIVAGRLVQTNFQAIPPASPSDAPKFLIEVPQASDVNHVVIFLTGVEPFPPGLAGQVYFGWPDENNQVAWHLLGHISNEKPSAIFKISNLKKSTSQSAVSPMFFGAATMGGVINNLGMSPGSPSASAQIGISVESAESVALSTPVASATPSNVSSFVEFSQKMLDNFVNYATSFGDTNYISLQTVKNWYENFQRRLQADPYFWK